DACLFASPVPFELARRAGVLTMPATHVQLSGAALIAALGRAALDERIDPRRVSTDVLNRAEVEEAYADLGLPANEVHCRAGPGATGTRSPSHEGTMPRASPAGPLTCTPAVADRLQAADLPVVRVRPTAGAVRPALNTAALLGAHHRLEESQLTVIIIEVP